MRIYKNCKEAASETKRELAEMGNDVKIETMQDKKVKDNPEFLTKELVGYSYMIIDPSNDKIELAKAFGKENEIDWAEAEIKERLDQKKANPGEAYKLRKVWEEFVHGGKFSYSYGERIGDQVVKVIASLRENPGSRNAIVSMWDPNIDIERIGGKMRVPCTMYYQFLIRDGKLNMIYNIRSNDLFTHWCWDIWLAISLQEYVASRLGIEVGFFMQQIGSLHGYQKDMKGIF